MFPVRSVRLTELTSMCSRVSLLPYSDITVRGNLRWQNISTRCCILPEEPSGWMAWTHRMRQSSGQVVEEDVGFGPENMGVPTKEIWQRVEEALKAVGMWEFRKKSPNRLSGGQKQRVSIAGVIAMHPKCIVMDEPTAMLDPGGRREVIRAARALNEVEKITIILITHHMEEAIYADHIYVMDQGKIALQGTPREVFSHVEQMQELHLDVPKVTLLAHELGKRGLKLPAGILTKEELAAALGLSAAREEHTSASGALNAGQEQ